MGTVCRTESEKTAWGVPQLEDYGAKLLDVVVVLLPHFMKTNQSDFFP